MWRAAGSRDLSAVVRSSSRRRERNHWASCLENVNWIWTFPGRPYPDPPIATPVAQGGYSRLTGFMTRFVVMIGPRRELTAERPRRAIDDI